MLKQESWALNKILIQAKNNMRKTNKRRSYLLLILTICRPSPLNVLMLAELSASLLPPSPLPVEKLKIRPSFVTVVFPLLVFAYKDP